MATDTTQLIAREHSINAVHCISATVGFADDGTAVTVGVIPAGSMILKPISGVHVNTAFDAGTTNTLNVGTSDDDNLYGTLLALGTTTFVPCDEAVGSYLVTADTTITATVVLTGTAATAGSGVVTINYIPRVG